jgi:hypothetical protein
MDLQDQRIACLRMAIEMGCKPDSVVATATDLMNFITSAAPTVPTTVTTPEVSEAERIAACGTEVPMTETADLALAPVVAAASAEAISAQAPLEVTPATDEATDVEPASVEPATVVSAATLQEPTTPVAEAAGETAPVAEPTPQGSTVATQEAAREATMVEATSVVTPQDDTAPVDASAETTLIEASSNSASVAAEAVQPEASVPVAPVAETIAAMAPLAEAGVVEQGPAAPAENATTLDPALMPAATAANGAANTEPAGVVAPAS